MLRQGPSEEEHQCERLIQVCCLWLQLVVQKKTSEERSLGRSKLIARPATRLAAFVVFASSINVFSVLEAVSESSTEP